MRIIFVYNSKRACTTLKKVLNDSGLKLISRFMTSQTRKQIIRIHILPNISRCKGNQTIKFGQLTWEKLFLKNHAENEAGRLVLDLFLFLRKLCMRSDQVVSTLVLICSGRPPLGHTISK